MQKIEKIDFLGIIKQNRKVVAVIMIAILLITLLFTLLQPFLYSSSVSLLIIQKNDSSVDAYSALSSSERIGDNLARIVYTTDFFDKVMDSGYKIDQSYFSQKENKKREQWEKMIDTQVNRGTGILKITVYHKSKDQALLLSRAIAYILTIQGWEYIGGGDISVKMVNSPLVSNWPVKPNIFLNLFSALAFGFLASIAYIVLSDRKNILNQEKKFKKSLLSNDYSKNSANLKIENSNFQTKIVTHDHRN